MVPLSEVKHIVEERLRRPAVAIALFALIMATVVTILIIMFIEVSIFLAKVESIFILT